jgi:hypothetical protein
MERLTSQDLSELKIILSKCLTELLQVIITNNYKLYNKEAQKVVSGQSSDVKSTVETLTTINTFIPDYFHSFYQQADPILKKYDYSEINKVINEKYSFLVGLYSNKFGGRGYTTEKLISKLIYIILKNPPKSTQISNSVNEIVDQFLKLIKLRKYKTKVYLPIENLSFSSDIPEICYTDNIVLRKLNYEELTDLFQNPYGHPDFYELVRVALIIEYQDTLCIKSIDKNIGLDPMTNFNRDIDYIIYSLNLVKNGSIFINSKIWRHDDFISEFLGNNSFKYFKGKIGFNANFSKEELEKSQMYYENIKSINLSAFELALKKLNEAGIRRSPQDSIIDAVIGMESLLLNKIGNEKTRGELKYRFSTNYSTLFPQKERINKYKEAKATYDIRSILVHGGKVKINAIQYLDQKVKLTDLRNIIINQLRELIVILLDNYKSEPFDITDYWLIRLLNYKSN